MSSNPIDTAFTEFERHGIKPLVKKRTATGALEDASERDLKALGDQSRFATTANNLQNLTPEERSFWAKDLKNKANVLFKEKEFQKANECYFEALAATNLEAAEHGGNVDDVVIPLLCNMAACSLQLKEWKKTSLLCDQALQIRPDCLRALVRSGLANVQLGEYDKAEAVLQKAAAVVTEADEEESKKIVSLMKRVRAGKAQVRKATEAQRAAMSKVFSSSKRKPPAPGGVKVGTQGNDDDKYTIASKSILPFHYSMKEVGLLSLAAIFFLGLALLLSAYLDPDHGSILITVVLFVLVTAAAAMYLVPKLPRQAYSRHLHEKVQ